MFTLNMLLRLEVTGAKCLKYVRTIATALATWSTWLDTSPGQLHVEESCEALLSKVVRTMRSHPGACTHQHYADLFTSLGVPKTKQEHCTTVPQHVLNRVRERLALLCTTQMVPPLAVWTPRTPHRVPVRSLPARVLDDGPAPLVQGLPSARYEKTLALSDDIDAGEGHA